MSSHGADAPIFPITYEQSGLRVEQRAPSALRPAGRQSRHHPKKQMAAIQKSIQTFGFVTPVLINSQDKVLAGNARIEAAKALGLSSVPVVVVDHLTPEQQRAFVLADNRLAELGSWNREVLQLELDELSTIELDFSIEATGFSYPEIDAIRFGVGGADVRDDDIPGVQPAPISALGDLWICGDQRLLVGDATSEVAVDRLLGGEPVRGAFMDPPYNVKIEGNVTSAKGHGEFVQGSGEMTDSQFTGLLSASLGQLERVMTPGAIGHICMDWRHMANMTSAIQTAGLELINLCVWDKTTPGMGSLYRSQHELVFVVKKPGAPHQNMVELGRNGRNRSNVWAYEGVIGAGVDKARERAMHPTVKPLALVKDAILDCTKKGDVVLDLFGGSGTTLIAAEKTGRRARLMELDPKYADVIIRRWQGFTGKAAVHHQSGRSFDDIALNGRALEDEAPAPRQRIRVRV